MRFDKHFEIPRGSVLAILSMICVHPESSIIVRILPWFSGKFRYLSVEGGEDSRILGATVETIVDGTNVTLVYVKREMLAK